MVFTVFLTDVIGFGLTPLKIIPRERTPAEHERRLPLLPSLSETGAATVIGITGDDPWVGFRSTDKELYSLIDEATAKTPKKPITRQFKARRSSLWRQWKGTIVRSVLIKECKYNVLWASGLMLVFSALPAGQQAELLTKLGPFNMLWKTGQTFAAFMLSFFLSKTYEFWQRVYSISRQAQGRCNDIAMLAVINGAREMEENGDYTPEALATLRLLLRYVRLSHVVWYASFTRLYAPIATPRGLKALEYVGTLRPKESESLLQTTSWYNAVIVWIGFVVTRGSKSGALDGGDAMMIQFNSELARLRATYASMGDALSGRMPMAYPHLVQILVDLLCLAAPFALVTEVGCLGAIIGTGLCTLFYSGIMNLAKMFLDPFDNDDYGGKSHIRVEVDTLVQEVNAACYRWESIGTTPPPGIADGVPEEDDLCVVPAEKEQAAPAGPANVQELALASAAASAYATAGLFGTSLPPVNATGLHTLADLASRESTLKDPPGSSKGENATGFHTLADLAGRETNER